MVYITASTPREQLEQYARLMNELGQAHVRGIAFALNGVAMDAKKRVTDGLSRTIDKPAPYTMRAINNRFIPLASTSLADASSEIFIRPDQSAYLKYLMGEGENVREPGDIGPADKSIYVPLWRNLARAEIRPLNGGSIPRSSLKRLLKGRKAAVGRKAAGGIGAYRNDGGFLQGRPTYGGQQHGLGIYMRPTRALVNGRVVNSGHPLMLIRQVQRAQYKPILQPLWDKSASAAMATLGNRLETELQNKLSHLGRDSIDPFLRDNGDDFLKAR